MGVRTSACSEGYGPRDVGGCASAEGLISKSARAPTEGAGVRHEIAPSYIRGGASSSRSHYAAWVHADASTPVSTPSFTPSAAESAVARIGLPAGFTPEIAALSADYLSIGEYNRLQRAGVVPKKETGMLVLSSNIFDDVSEGCEYISPTADQPGFQMPTNRETFSFTTSDVTVPGILRLLAHTVPWNITILTVILQLETLVEDLAHVTAMLPDIAIALIHAKYLVLTINKEQFVFNCGKATVKRDHVKVGRGNIELIGDVFTCVSEFARRIPDGSIFDFSKHLLRNFPRTELTSNILHSIKLTLDFEKEDALTFCRQITTDPENPLDSRLQLSAEANQYFMLKRETLKFLPYFFDFVLMVNAVSALPIPLDFSTCDRMVSFKINCSNRTPFSPIKFPANKSNLEMIELNINNYKGDLTFTGSEPFPRLREFRVEGLPAGGSTIRLDSRVFPALERVRCHSPISGGALDLSGIEKPGLKLQLGPHNGALVLPAVGLGQLLVTGDSLNCAAIEAALPKVHDLNFWGRSPLFFKRLLEILQGSCVLVPAEAGAGSSPTAGEGKRADLSLTSVVLERLVLRALRAVEVHMGIFLHLQSLELYDISTVLDGINFPLLDSLIMGHCDARVSGNFPSLFSLKLQKVEATMRIDCIAPMLNQLECICVDDATNVAVGHVAFPLLRSLLISVKMGYICTDSPPLKFAQDIPSDWASAIIVRLRVESQNSSYLPALVNTVKHELPGCSIFSGTFY